MKVVKAIFFAVVGLVLIAVVGVVAYRAAWQHRIAGETRITSANGVDEASYVDIRGAQEWITIRGQDQDNPVILFLHGGPAEANSPFVTLYRPFEKDFVFVQWDQPGAGKTYIRAGVHQPALSLDSIADQGVAVAEYLRNRLHKQKIVLIGQDWGALVGLRMIKLRPDLFQAFVGTDLAVSWLGEQDGQYAFTQRQAAAANDQKTLDGLKQIGPPPYRSLAAYRGFGDYFEPYKPAEDRAAEQTLRAWLFLSPSLSFPELADWVKALRAGEETLTPELMKVDLRQTDASFSVPVFLIEGADNVITPPSLDAEYLAKVQAPAKRLDLVPGASYMVIWQHPAAFLRLLKADLRSAPGAPG